MADHRPPEEVIAHYRDHAPERGRLTAGQGRLELARTQELIVRHLPAGSLKILDVGGATGVYASWLASMGHVVHLIDPVVSQIEDALRSAGTPEVHR
jgi:2-polyprenyl-3-methyl-5-hydroxy-6-metoxy-1,4-benzoquinol methylase